MLPQGYNNNQHQQNNQPYKIINYRQPQVDNIPGPNFENPDPSFLNVSKSICKIRIDTNLGSFGGSGFFLKFLINGKFYYWLVTNEHVITKEMINNKNTIQVLYNIESNSINIKLDQSERYIKTFKEYKVDATVIQIRSKDNVYKDYFLEPELGYDSNDLVLKEIFIPQFPGFQQIKNARGIIKNINYGSPNEFTHLAKTQKGSSGSPIFLKGNKKVIGIHKEGDKFMQENYGDFIAPIISILTNEFMNIFNRMQINQINDSHNNNQINNNISLNTQNSFGQVSTYNNNSNFLVGPTYPINQLKSPYEINPNMNNNIATPGNLNNFNALNGNNRIAKIIKNNNNLNAFGNLNNPNININNFNHYNLIAQEQMNTESDERYIGQLVNGLRCGKGTVYYKENGKIKYEGDFVNGKYEGYGELYDKNGNIKYKGFFKNNKFEGNGKLYGNNFDYIGSFMNGLKHGKGIEYHKNGKIHFEGIFINDKYERNVKLYYDNGAIEFEGFYLNGLKNGKGKEYYKDGKIKYDGVFKNGQFLEGKGKLYNEEGYILYEGDFKNGKYEGNGKEYYNNYSSDKRIKYEGGFKNGKYDGKGILYCDCFEKKILYEGDFKNGEYNGKGREYYDKSYYRGKIKYEGDFKNGKYEGKGILYNKDIYYSVIKYKGDFKNGEYEKKRKIFDENGNIKYEGDFQNCKFSGKGKEYFENGNIKYEGDFKNGEYEGEGKLYYSDDNGKIEFIGNFKNSKKEGEGKEYYKNGDIKFEGIFKNGYFSEGKGKLYHLDFGNSGRGKIEYEGEFKNGCYEGYGALYNYDGTIKYYGKFEKGKPDNCLIF